MFYADPVLAVGLRFSGNSVGINKTINKVTQKIFAFPLMQTYPRYGIVKHTFPSTWDSETGAISSVSFASPFVM